MLTRSKAATLEKLSKAEELLCEINSLLDTTAEELAAQEPAEHGRGKLAALVGHVVPRVFRRKVTIKPDFKCLPKNHAQQMELFYEDLKRGNYTTSIYTKDGRAFSLKGKGPFGKLDKKDC